MRELEEITQKIAKNKTYLKDTYGVEEIGVFGSFARGDNDLNNDVDIPNAEALILNKPVYKAVLV
ncbi:MAG: polymerase beta domain protein region protein [Candidatus Nomurabacteria bacterium GW2011_GWA2_40_9]|uniref:Polymerase beta domain protein region protein n=1 Tax=Candidatus Nomurabacteria bacterium GW2011_GWA2_40_9 TaxID=1618734 RepID=A0A0G0TSE9_9BACT|nr:MAG: polymerase beta domain protein region protein [Candidatus Nomurabacteria bacterium GW2011_GWA2_40_9]